MQTKEKKTAAPKEREQSQKPSLYGGHFRDLQGQVFGRLTAVHPTARRDEKGSVVWACLCRCERIIYVPGDRLISGKTKSCGCLKEQVQAEADISSYLHFIEGTCVEWIEKRTHRKDNTSGFRGVYKVKDGRYRAMICFQGKRHHLGYFVTFEEAKQARMEAEEHLYKPFLEAYYSGCDNR